MAGFHTGATLGVDFGTSNSAAGIMRDGKPHLIEIAPGATTLPSAIFLDFDARRSLYGEAASAALIEGREGRYLRALKRALGTPLFREERQLMNARRSLLDLLSDFLRHIREQAEARTGLRFTRVLSGRPVLFHSGDPARNARAEADLSDAYRAAGFAEIAYLPEPEAAVIASGGARGLGLLVDIGGGTSDFSLFEPGPDGVRIVTSHGVSIGGTDLDMALSLAHAMPLLGMGSDIRREMGAGTMPVPRGLFLELAAWEKIPFLYTAQTRRDAQALAALAPDPTRLGHLCKVLDYELGHEVAFAVERGKIAANDGTRAFIDLGMVAPGLGTPLDAQTLGADITALVDRIEAGARATLTQAGVQPEALRDVVYVGGSSLITAIQTRLHRLAPDAAHRTQNVFTAVADGLAIASSGTRDGS